MYTLNITEQQRRVLKRALMVSIREDKKSDNKEAQKAVGMETIMLGMLEKIKEESKN